MSVAVVICDSDTDLYTDTGKLITSVIVDTANLHNLVNLKTAGLKSWLQSILDGWLRAKLYDLNLSFPKLFLDWCLFPTCVSVHISGFVS